MQAERKNGAWRSPVSALGWGPRGRRFESSRPDLKMDRRLASDSSVFGTLVEVQCPFGWKLSRSLCSLLSTLFGLVFEDSRVRSSVG